MIRETSDSPIKKPPRKDNSEIFKRSTDPSSQSIDVQNNLLDVLDCVTIVNNNTNSVLNRWEGYERKYQYWSCR